MVLVRLVLIGLVATWAGLAVAAAPPEPQIVVEDWYLRESLRAIRDWEAILQRLQPDADSKKNSLRVVLPLPEDGQAVSWPNPFPSRLIPRADRAQSVQFRRSGDQIQIERLAGKGQANNLSQDHQEPSPRPENAGAARGSGIGSKTEKIPADQPIVGYQHPGGGGKDQWYHAYHRRFDRLGTFSAVSSPLALELATPVDWHRGAQQLKLTLRNSGAAPLAVALRLDLHAPRQSRPGASRAFQLAPGASQSLALPVVLTDEGGTLVGLSVEAGPQRFWIPLLTHVEDVGSVLQSIQQILADTPDAAASAALAGLQSRAVADLSRAAPTAWRALFQDASRLRDRLLRSRIGFDALLFVKRKPYISEQPFMDAHHLWNRPGGGVFRLSPVSPEGRVAPLVDALGEGVYRDLALDWPARKLLFAFGNGSDKWTDAVSYHVYQANVDGSGLRQLTTGPKNDCEPFWLADGRIGFTSDRSEHYVMCGGNRHSPTLFVMEPDGSHVRQLSFNCFNDFNPSMLPDGRILYSRWEYNERSVTSLHNPFTMNPDGTMVQPYYGNATIRPNVVMFPRPVPGSSKVMALFTAHHGQTHGSVGLIDVRRGIDGPGPLEVLTPNVPITGEKAEDSRYGWFSDPQPLSENTWLCSYTPTLQPWLAESWALYVADRHGNLALVYRDPEISCAEPLPLVPRAVPHVRPAAPLDASESLSTLVVADVYRGLTGVARGSARYLRILEDVPRKSVPEGGVITTSGTLIFTVKRIFGTVPIEPDGSAHFTVPADRNVYFEVLDDRFREIQRMRSVVCLKPGEVRSCIGCHEGRHTAPPAVPVLASRRAPSTAELPPWNTQTLSYLRDVQPVINARCVACHTHDRTANKVILTDDLTDQFVVGYEELLPYLTVAISNRWDNPDDVLPRPPLTYGSKVSRLTRLLEAGHHGVELSADEWQRLLIWIDANGVYYDRYETNHWPDRRIFRGPVQEAAQAVYARRCTSCHAKGEGRGQAWLSLNARDVRASRMLAAPLARSAGGWGRCKGVVFADAADLDYQALLALLTDLSRRLKHNPREDLLSITGGLAGR